jgi:antitoxin PrlF
MLGAFLDFLARDMAAHPDRLRALDAGLVERSEALVKDVEIDIDAPLSLDDE